MKVYFNREVEPFLTWLINEMSHLFIILYRTQNLNKKNSKIAHVLKNKESNLTDTLYKLFAIHQAKL